MSRFRFLSIPFALLVFTVFAFGLLLNRLGFYQDDWHFVYNAYARGTGSMWPLLYTDGRPLAAWPYVLGFSLIGFSPLPWQILSVLLRWLTGLGFFLTMDQLWPGHRQRNFFVALIFTIHPFFTLQPLSVAYAPHWTAFALYTFSLYWMIRAITEPQKAIRNSALAIIFTAAHIFTIEYFAGLELVRPLLLWLALRTYAPRPRLKKWAAYWLPYLLIFLAFVIWRRYIFNGPRAEMPGVDQLLGNPFGTMLYYAQVIWADINLILVNAWTRTVEARFFDFSDGTNLWILAIGLLTGLAAFWFARRLPPNEDSPSPNWQLESILLGATWLVAGLAPTYAIGEIIFLRNPLWSSRLGLASLPGAALLTWMALDTLLAAPKARFVVLAILAGLAASWNTRNANEYRWAWARQERLYQQLTERAPALAPNTAILAEQEILPYMGDYPTTYGVNSIYARQKTATARAPLWFFAVSESFLDQQNTLLEGIPLQAERHISTFSGNSLTALFISYNDALSPCLWVLAPDSANLKDLSPFLRKAGTISALGQIQPRTAPGPSFLDLIHSPGPLNWCTLYQKSDLARQYKEWEQIRQNWEVAQSNKLHPFHGYEYIPFIEAYAHLEEWETAYELMRNANRANAGMDTVLCPLWAKIMIETKPSPQRDKMSQQMAEKIGCGP